VILVSYINKLRLEGATSHRHREAALLAPAPDHDDRAGGLLGLLCPPRFRRAIGSDTQKPFAIVIVAGLVSRLFSASS